MMDQPEHVAAKAENACVSLPFCMCYRSVPPEVVEMLAKPGLELPCQTRLIAIDEET
jgi:hypothetical protein